MLLSVELVLLVLLWDSPLWPPQPASRLTLRAPARSMARYFFILNNLLKNPISLTIGKSAPPGGPFRRGPSCSASDLSLIIGGRKTNVNRKNTQAVSLPVCSLYENAAGKLLTAEKLSTISQVFLRFFAILAPRSPSCQNRI